MRSSNFFYKLISTGMLSLVLGIFGVQVAEAQSRIFLLDTTCVTTRTTNSFYTYWGSENRDIAVGREIYTSIMYIKNGDGFSCRLREQNSAPKFQTLYLGFGIPDTEDIGEIVLTVYIDGNQLGYRTVSRGEAKTWPIDVKNARSVALEVTCSSRNCPDSLRFFEASLESIPSSPGGRN